MGGHGIDKRAARAGVGQFPAIDARRKQDFFQFFGRAAQA